MRFTLSFDRETKNTVRFQEDGPGPVVVGTLYIQKAAWEQIGKPQQVTVSIEAAAGS